MNPASSDTEAHVPVLLAEAVAALGPHDGALYLDGTFGAGGYSRALLEAARCRVVAFDRDPDAVRRGADLARRYPDRLTLIEGRFSEMETLLKPLGITAVSGVALDLGVSSMQLDEAERGFSFRDDGPLDMRMARSGETAADLVNTLSETALTTIIRDYGEERFARRVARAILAKRAQAPITRTGELAAIVRRAVPEAGHIDAATRTFQALRIAVNDELGELERGLIAAERLLSPGGRIAVISFHSLEDRIVKAFLRTRSAEAPRASRHAPDAQGPASSFTLINRKPIAASEAETQRNPRARSARLRAAERTAAPAWPVPEARA
ncbi:MAG TPA: 16S rRNA (cytosine(1402)-N(4))-methyltransferase RsmH [Stellaceae bacterium]|jgi:16S rRNA (cytosine1402-N4)-methyltransferase|nr:16S rRNA (cytosine(1402)-N(4))-methyltransferase RsmH [Stellaceae bacterium]